MNEVLDNAVDAVETVSDEVVAVVEKTGINKTVLIAAGVGLLAAGGFAAWKVLKKRAAKKILAEVDEIIASDEEVADETVTPIKKSRRSRTTSLQPTANEDENA